MNTGVGHFFLYACFSFCAVCPAQPEKLAQQLATNTTFVAFDTETTGLSATKDRIVEIALTKFKNGKITSTNSWLINPGMPIPKGAQRVHGISDEMVKEKPPCEEILPKISRFVGNAVLVAHNARFDLRFLENEYKRASLAPPENICMDTLKLSRKWFPESKSHSLKKLLEHLDVKPDKKFHRALADSQYIVNVMDKGISTMGRDITIDRILKLHGTPLVISKKKERKDGKK